jgi:hypothetical protein
MAVLLAPARCAPQHSTGGRAIMFDRTPRKRVSGEARRQFKRVVVFRYSFRACMLFGRVHNGACETAPGGLEFAVGVGLLERGLAMPRVLTVCPIVAQTVPTQAVMSAASFKRLKVGMAIYCPACSQPHLAERRHLWLETAHARPGQPPPDHIAKELTPAGAKRNDDAGCARI